MSMTTTAVPPTTFAPIAEAHFDSLRSYSLSPPPPPPTPPAAEPPSIVHSRTPRQLRSCSSNTNRYTSHPHHHCRSCSPHPCFSSAVSSPTVSSTRSPGTTPFPAGASAPVHVSATNSGNSPLLRSPPLLPIKTYGTASDVNDDAAGTRSTVVLERASVATSADTPLTNLAATTGETTGTAHDTPPPTEEAPLGGSRVRDETGVVTVEGTTANSTAAATRVNNLLLVGGGDSGCPVAPQSGRPSTLQAPRNNYAEREGDPAVPATAAATAAAYTLRSGYAHADGQADRTTYSTLGLVSPYDPHSSERRAQHADIMPRCSGGGAVVEGGGEKGDGSSSAPAKPTPVNLRVPDMTRRSPPGPFGYISLNNTDDGEGSTPNNAAGNVNGGFYSPTSGGPPPTFVELALRRIRTTSLLQFLWVIVLIVMLMVGNACQVIFLNFWIHQFPTKRSPASSSCASGSSSHSSSSNNNNNNDPDSVETLASSYTTFVISGAIFSGFFILLLIIYGIWRRPNLNFVREGAGWRLLFGIGAMDTLNSAMAIYAAAHTPEVLQALFVSLVPIYSAFFTKWLLKDPRNYANVYVVISFALIMAGVALASLFSYAATHHNHDADNGNRTFLFSFTDAGSSASAANRNRRIWCLIFFLSVPPTVLLNVLQTLYMIRYTQNDEMTAYLTQHEGDSEDSTRRISITSSGEVRTEVEPGIHDEFEDPHEGPRGAAQRAGEGREEAVAATATTATTSTSAPPSGIVAVLASGSASSSHSSSARAASDEIETSIQHEHRLHVSARDLLLHGEDTTVKLVMLAADTTIQALMAFCLMPMDALPWFGGSDSIREVWQNLDDGVDCVLHCPKNLRYCLLYSMGFVLVYIAAAYLNRYSVTLCSMVSQLSGPITALVLIAFPSLNMTGDAAPWYVSVFAVVLLSFGTIIYVYWDEMTGEEKASGEMQLKWAMMEEQAQQHHAVDNGGESGQHAGSVSDVAAADDPSRHHRHSRSRRYRRRRQSSYMVVVDCDPDNRREPHPSNDATSHH